MKAHGRGWSARQQGALWVREQNAPAAGETALPSAASPRPLICVWVATLSDLVVDVTSSMRSAMLKLRNHCRRKRGSPITDRPAALWAACSRVSIEERYFAKDLASCTTIELHDANLGEEGPDHVINFQSCTSRLIHRRLLRLDRVGVRLGISVCIGVGLELRHAAATRHELCFTVQRQRSESSSSESSCLPSPQGSDFRAVPTHRAHSTPRT